MSFVNPWFLLGILAAAVPILLHLIKRESAQKIEFSTLMFLRKISKRTIRYQKLRHLLLLLVRILILLLLALGFMRPYRDRPQTAAATGRATQAHVILLDNSMSMAYGDRWGQARRAAADIVRRAEPGDKVSLIEFADQTKVVTLPATDFGVVLSAVDNLTGLTDRATRYGQALKIAEKSALDAGADKHVIHLISDFQKSGWATEEHDFRLSSGIRLECTDVGSDHYSNLALGEVRILEGADDKGGGLRIRFSVVNFGTEERDANRVTLSVDERIVSEKSVDVARGAVQGMEFELPGLTAGVHNVALEVVDHGLTRDNRFAMTLESRAKIPVLSVENPNAGRAGRSPSFFVANALNISTLSPYRLSAVTPTQFAALGHITGGLLIWNNVAADSAAVQRKLQDFVKGGGGLIIVLADNSSAAEFNRSFGAWLPFQAAETAGNAGRRTESTFSDEYALLTDLRADHPIFRPFSEPYSGSFSTARFYRHARVVAGEKALVLARFDNGDPALLSADVDKGRILLLAFAADDSTNDLPVKAVFVPFWHQVLRYLEGFREERQWLEVGDTLAPKKLLVEAAIRQGKGNIDLNQAIVVMDPAKQRVPMAPGSDVLALDVAGFYDIRMANINAGVAVNPSLLESDLSHGNAEEMAAGWMSGETQTPAMTSSDERPTPEQQDKRTRFWRYILLSVLLLLVVEGLLANRFILKPD